MVSKNRAHSRRPLVPQGRPYPKNGYKMQLNLGGCIGLGL